MQVRRDSRDRGAVLVWLALSMPVLLGFGALIVDVGRMYVEERELQNGADAAALAAATLCADGRCAQAGNVAVTLTNANSADGASAVELCGRGAPGIAPCASDPPGLSSTMSYVTARTTTVDPSNGDPSRLDLLLAPVLGSVGPDPSLEADASAAFGALSSTTTLNLVMSQCEFRRVGGVIGSGQISNQVVEILFREEASACVRPNGFALPGGFGWVQGAVRCNRPITVPGTLPERPGKAIDNDCELSTLINRTVSLPVFSGTNGLGGSNGAYTIDGFVSFVLTGYSFPGNRYPNGFRCSGGSSVACIVGYFTTALLTSGGTTGVDYGTRAVALVD
jgi:Flp pilus assembly protein TadG